MKKRILTFLFIASLILVAWNVTSYKIDTTVYKKKNNSIYKNGDVILQTSETAQCEAVRIATNSKFSHCGIIFIENGKPFVYEAVQPVSKTSLEAWIKNGKEKKYVIRRIKDTLSQEQQKNMLAIAKSYLNKNYDIYFEWNDNTIYCSELVWKIYKNGANIELCKTKELKDFSLDHPIVKEILKQRYGNTIPLTEKVVAPAQLHETETLETIFDNY